MRQHETRRIVLEGVITTVKVEGNKLVTLDGRIVDTQRVSYLPPVTPTKIICVHLNYHSRVQELEAPTVPEPTYFMKAVSSLNSHHGQVIRPRGCNYLNYEGEIGIIIGRTTRNISVEEAKDYILGYTIANDFGLHDFRHTDANSMVRVKGSDTLGPVGPGVVSGWDWHDKRIRTFVDGRVVQEDTTNGMIWGMEYLVADLARLITLEPGDIILSGTPANSRPVEPGDVVEVEVEGLGRLTNTIVEGAEDLRMTTCGAQPSNTAQIHAIAMGNGFKMLKAKTGNQD